MLMGFRSLSSHLYCITARLDFNIVILKNTSRLQYTEVHALRLAAWSAHGRDGDEIAGKRESAGRERVGEGFAMQMCDHEPQSRNPARESDDGLNAPTTVCILRRFAPRTRREVRP